MKLIIREFSFNCLLGRWYTYIVVHLGCWLIKIKLGVPSINVFLEFQNKKYIERNI